MELHLSGATSLVSPWVARWSHLVARGASVLDVACGSGRHVRWFAGRGARVTALDRNADDLAGLQGIASETVVADIEAAPWPLAGRRFDAVVVTNYLHRPLMPTLVGSVAPGGVFIYETFGVGQARFGRPSNPAFLLEPGELWRLTEPLRVVAYEDGIETHRDGSRRCVQRIVSVADGTGLGQSPSHDGRPLADEEARSSG